MIRALTLLALLAVPAAAYETAASSCDLQYRQLECGFNGDACPSTCSTSSNGECTLPTADLAKWTADYAASLLTATSVMVECAAITTASSCTGNCAMGTSDAGVATCYATYAKISSLMTADGAPAALVEGYWQTKSATSGSYAAPSRPRPRATRTPPAIGPEAAAAPAPP